MWCVVFGVCVCVCFGRGEQRMGGEDEQYVFRQRRQNPRDQAGHVLGCVSDLHV